MDWATHFPALYVEVAVNDAYVKLGPFTLSSIRDGVIAALEPIK